MSREVKVRIMRMRVSLYARWSLEECGGHSRVAGKSGMIGKIVDCCRGVTKEVKRNSKKCYNINKIVHLIHRKPV